MKILSTHTQPIPSSAASVYGLWARPTTWPSWDPDVVDVKFAGDVGVGAKGWMRPASGPASTFEVTSLETDQLFTTRSRLPGATLSFEHVVEAAGGGSRIRVTVSVDGPLSALWGRVLRTSFRDAASRNVAGLAAYLATS